MQFLHDQRGRHVANAVNGQLHAPTGENIGHFLANHNFFIDVNGRYLGEIVHGNRLMTDRFSSWGTTNFGVYGNYGNVGNYGNPGNCGDVGSDGRHEDVAAGRLLP
jgi:hypothetical protein